MDIQAAKALAEIAGIECESYARSMFAAGSNLKLKTPDEIFNQDFKEFEFGDVNVGIGQVTSLDKEELAELKDRMIPYIREVYKKKELDMIFFMLTSIIDTSSELICIGQNADELVQEAFHSKVENNCAVLPGVVSRKKQLVPSFMMAISQL
jgi:manganese-dependent inorganic pyrophosphatase